jgi:DNA (cytosine-5)-methyltransferase 1
LFSGIGAPELAAPDIDWRWSAEIDPFASAVLAERFPGVPNLGDVTKLDPDTIELVDIVVAGTPCQDFSVAGLRRGLDGDRGNLTLAFVRLFDAIDNLRRHRGLPGLIGLWENVPGVLSDRRNAFGCFLAAMAGCDAALVPPNGCGWKDAGVVVGPKRSIAWRLLDAQYFGLAQRRKRVFAAFGSQGWPVAAALFPQSEGVRRDTAPSREAGQGIARPIASCAPGGSGYRADSDTAENLVTFNNTGQGWWNDAETATGLRDMSAGSGSKEATLVAYGGNRQSGPIDIATAVNAHGGPHGRMDFESETFVTHSLSSHSAGSATEDGTGRGTPLVPIAFSCKDDGLDASEISPTLRSGNYHRSHANAGVMPAVAFAENSRAELRLEGGDGQTTSSLKVGGGKPGQSYPAIAFQSSQSGMRTGEAHATLDSNNGSRRHHGAMVGTAVRRLTPRECERLQGFPDDFTLIRYNGKPAADGSRYRALGNAMAVPVVRWILSRIE